MFPNPTYTIDREAIWCALFNLLQTQLFEQYFEVMGRIHVQPPQLPIEAQPALFLVQARETKAPRPQGTPGKLTLSGFIILYFQCPQPLQEPIGQETTTGAGILNQLLQAVDQALLPDDIVSGRLTLGGLVQHCWLEGDTDLDTGIYTQQGAAVLPIKILVP